MNALQPGRETVLYADRSRLTAERAGNMTSGSVNAGTLQFYFSPDWEGLDKTAVFRAGDRTAQLPLPEDGRCAVPREVLVRSGVHLEAGVYGVRGEDRVLPTVWADLGMVLEGAVPGGETPGTTPGSGPETGGTDHRSLTHRDAENQHPIEAISGLEEISNLAVLKLWNGG